MTKNIGNLDRILRIIIGVGLIAASLIGALPAWGWIGVIPLVTALVGWCPLYRVIGVRTCKLPPA